MINTFIKNLFEVSLTEEKEKKVCEPHSKDECNKTCENEHAKSRLLNKDKYQFRDIRQRILELEKSLHSWKRDGRTAKR